MKKHILNPIGLLVALVALITCAFTLDGGKILGGYRLTLQPASGYVHTNIVQIYDAGTNAGLQILTNTSATIVIRMGGSNFTALSRQFYTTNSGVCLTNRFINGILVQEY